MPAGSIIKDEEQLQTLLGLLKNNKLPYKDIELTNSLFKLYGDDAGTVIGSGGLEFYSEFALLRSVSVAESARGRSLGKDIVRDLLQEGLARGVVSVYLLTETAPLFFEKSGFVQVPREKLPDAIKASSEFSSVCPTSAICMKLEL